MLLSERYRQEQAQQHATGTYGTASLQYGDMVSSIVERSGAKTLLDYGCGSMRNLAKVLDCDVLYQGYDPAVPEFSADPDAADLVVCIDVLEHIEPNCLSDVLEHIKSKTLGHVFFTVHTGPAKRILSNGRNAHLIQQPASWWLPELMDRWTLLQFQANKHGFWVVMHGN